MQISLNLSVIISKQQQMIANYPKRLFNDICVCMCVHSKGMLFVSESIHNVYYINV